MTVHEVGALIQSQEGVRHATLTMAFGIIMERVKSLPRDDMNDLYELAKGLPHAKCGEEIDSIFAAMMEILDQNPVQFAGSTIQTHLRKGFEDGSIM